MCEIRLPHSDEFEKLVLGLCFISDKSFALASQKLASRDFYGPKNSRIFIILGEMAAKGEPIDVPLFCCYARKRGFLEACGGITYIASLLDGLPRSEEKNLLHYCRELRLLSLQREVVKRCYKVVTVPNGLEPDEEVKELATAINLYFKEKTTSKAFSEGQNESAEFSKAANS